MSEINTSVSLLKKFINGLKSKVIEYRRLLKLVRTYLSSLNRKDVQKVLWIHEKVTKFLDVFVLELMKNYASTMKIGLMIKSFDASRVEESDLYTHLSEQTYNEQVEAFNKSIARFDLMRSKLEKGDLITSDDRTLVIDVFDREFKGLVGLERDEGYRLWEALRSITGELKMIGRNAGMLSVKTVSSRSGSPIKMRLVKLTAFDSVKPKAILSKNRRKGRTFEYTCQVDETPAIQRKGFQAFESQESVDKLVEGPADLAKLPLETGESDYLLADWGSDFGDSVYSMGTGNTYKDSMSRHQYKNTYESLEEESSQDLGKAPLESKESDYPQTDSEYDLGNSSIHSMETDYASDNSLSEPQHVYESIEGKPVQDLAKLPLNTKESGFLPSNNLKSDSGHSSPNKTETNPTFEDSLSRSQHVYATIIKKPAQDPSLPLQDCCFLHNANKKSTYRTGTKRFILKNSCGFDAIAQILLANVTDYPNFEPTSQNSKVMDFILKLRTSPCSDATSLRNDFLVSKHTAIAKAPSLVIDVFGTIVGVWMKYFDELPSAYRHYACHPENRDRKAAFEIVKLGPIRKISIEEELKDFESEKFVCPQCRKMTETYFEMQNYLFIDLTISSGAKKYRCRLNMFTQKLNFLGTKFRLAGVIEGDSDHFKAYVRRINDDWELYDDLKEKVSKCFAFDVIAPEAVVYIRE